MSDAIYVNEGRASMAYVGEKPWHGMGQELTPDAPMKVWKHEAGMEWEIKSSPVRFTNGEDHVYTGKRVLYRSDTGVPLSIVSDEYKPVHPGEILEFFEDLVAQDGMHLNTAGVLMGGTRYWALADTGRADVILGNDKIKGMLLLVTSCDGSLATQARFTSVRVVCNNLLSMALQESGQLVVATRHKTVFDPTKVKLDLGLVDKKWDAFISTIKEFGNQKISTEDSKQFVYDLMKKPSLAAKDQPYTVARDTAEILNRIKNGMGSNTAEGTLWGTLNAVTEWVDHDSRERTPDKKLLSSWFGKGEKLKNKAFAAAVDMIS